MKSTNAQQIANCIAGTVVCVVFAPFLTVMSFRTLTLFEIPRQHVQTVRLSKNLFP